MSGHHSKDALSPQQVTVDALEGKYARIELPDGTTADWLLSTLPQGIQEGDVLTVTGQGERRQIAIDHTETRQRRQQAQTELEALNQDAPGGEITL